jgi:HlyD family secretion protein
MNERLFRKVSLERLASPDHLDQIVRISASHSWLALSGLLLLTFMTAAWAWKGSIPTTVVGNGMIVRTGGLLTVVSRGSGLVVSMNVAVGEHVRANQILAQIAQPALAAKIREIKQAIVETHQKHQIELALRKEQSRLEIGVIERQRDNTFREIAQLGERVELAEQDVPLTDQLFVKGLVTKHQTIAVRQTLVDLKEQIEDRRAKLKQFDQQMDAARVAVRQAELDMKQELSLLEQSSKASEAELSRVQSADSPVDGEVIELKVAPGGTVAEDAPIVTIQPDHDSSLELVAYVAASMAKECHTGMAVQVSPSVAKREEFGYMQGQVTFVADYPATAAALMRQFQNESLVSSLINMGPISEIRARLELDPNSFSGFRWSSSKGPAVRITSGTISEVHVVTRVQSPITLLLPWLKHGAGLE